MKKILAAAIVALVPTAAMASDGNAYDGFASFSAGYNSLDAGSWSNESGNFQGSTNSSSGNNNGKADGLDLEARASAAVPLGGAFAAQIDGVFSRTGYKWSTCEGCNTQHVNESTLAVHAFKRNPKKGLVGLIGQRTSQDWSGGPALVTYYVGGESQAFLGRVTAVGQLTYVIGDTNGYYSQDGVNVAMQLRYFPKDNLMFAVRGGHEQLIARPGSNSGYNCPDYCFRDKSTGWEVGGKAEYRLPKSRLSFLADVDYRDLSNRNDYRDYPNYWSSYQNKYSDIRAMVGVKLNFGSGTLFERDRSGASLDPVRAISDNMFGFGS